MALQVAHLFVSSPIRPGHVVSPGLWLAQCGLASVYPVSCENRFLHVDRQGKVLLYNAQRQVEWEMLGAVCPGPEEKDSEEKSKKKKKKDAADCVPGLHFREDGSIAVGGQPVSWVTQYQNDQNSKDLLSPWPFAEPPKLKVWKK